MALCVAAPYALTSASNFFEIAVAAAIALFCCTPRAAPATVVGVLVELVVSSPVVRVTGRSRRWYEAGAVRHAGGGS